MKASKLPSGNWRVQLYLGKKNGKEVRKSITGRTKKEAEQKAAKYISENHLDDSPMTIGEAVSAYIGRVEPVISPSTLRTYRSIERSELDGISSYMSDKVTNDDLQEWIGDFSDGHRPKTVRNAFGLVRSALTSVRPAFIINVKLPAKDAQTVLIPSDDDVQEMIKAADPELKKCILLAAFGSLRRGEVCYLRFKDIKDGCVHVHGDIVKSRDNKWVEKDHAKTSKSNRQIRLPDYVVEALGTGQDDVHVVDRNPKWVTDHFASLMGRLNMPYHFHLLRHYFASVLIAQGVPKAYIQALGGWETGGSLDRIYTHILQTSRNDYSKKVADYFSKFDL